MSQPATARPTTPAETWRVLRAGNARFVAGTPLHPRHFNPALDDLFVNVIADMMEKQVSDRIADAETVLLRLRPWTMKNEPVIPVAVPPVSVEPPPVPDEPMKNLRPFSKVTSRPLARAVPSLLW